MKGIFLNKKIETKKQQGNAKLIRRQKTNMSRKVNTVSAKYCKVCHDAGKPETVFRSHCIRESSDVNSKLVCPTLLALECRYCHKAGHTIKYCPIIKDKVVVTAAATTTTAKPMSKSPNVTNKFAALNFDDESNDDDEIIKTKSNPKAPLGTTATTYVSFPSLPSKASTTTATATAAPKLNFAAAAAKIVAKPVSETKTTIVAAPIKPKIIVKSKKPVRDSWFNNDSDPEEEEEDELYNDYDCEENDGIEDDQLDAALAEQKRSRWMQHNF